MSAGTPATKEDLTAPANKAPSTTATNTKSWWHDQPKQSAKPGEHHWRARSRMSTARLTCVQPR